MARPTSGSSATTMTVDALEWRGKRSRVLEGRHGEIEVGLGAWGDGTSR